MSAATWRRAIPRPLRRATFRRLWLGMSASYAGDQLQQIAQAWLVATLTGSALAVGWIAALGSLPLLLLPLGGAVADQLDRRRLLLGGQLLGAAATAIVAALALLGRAEVWHIYAWAFVNGAVALVSRPAYKVVLTEAVPRDELQAAVAVNSMTETTALLAVNAVGSALLGVVGLPAAFVLNTASYLCAALAVRRLPPAEHGARFSARRALHDLAGGFAYLARQPALLHPLLHTFALIAVAGPALGLLAAVVHRQAGTIAELGLLAAGFGLGALGGAAYAGARGEGGDPLRRYALLGMLAAAALALFASVPVGLISLAPLGAIGFVSFAEAVWNTARVRRLAPPAYQARLQAITSMAFTLGLAVGMLWAGVAIDRFGPRALAAGAVALAAVSGVSALRRLRGQLRAAA